MPKIRHTSDGRFVFFCPGCQCGHGIKTTGDGPKWAFNGDVEKPTISPSILVHEHDTILPENDSTGKVTKTFRCHSFVTDGNIQFLDDCTHELKGKTVPLEDFY
jgi:hypothetical protein